jgi:ATP-dependent RNA circularization protein (DNA/RNA ligase family)
VLAGEVVVEEKVDGANVGLSVDGDGNVRAQNRGRWLTPGDHPQFGPLWPWMHARADLLRQHLGEHLIVFGEWCIAVHSVHYDQLPDWFLGFDVHDRRDGEFWSLARRNELLEQLQIQPVPELLRGRTSLPELKRLLERTKSRVGTGPAEGLYIRRESSERLLARAKLVRPDFLQQIEEHWLQRPLQRNRVLRRDHCNGYGDST